MKHFFESAEWCGSCEATSNGSAKQRLLVPWKLHTEIDKRFFIKTSEKINHNKTVKKFTKRVFKTQDPVFQRYEIQLVKRSSKKERRVDALALRAEERRDKLRKAAGRSKYPLNRRYLNGETRLDELQSSIRQSITYGREPGELKHLSSRRNRKKQVLSLERKIDFQSSGERNGKRPNHGACTVGFGPHNWFVDSSRKVLGKPAREGESPVSERKDDMAESRVHRDTRNLDGMSGDHPVSLNTP